MKKKLLVLLSALMLFLATGAFAKDANISSAEQEITVPTAVNVKINGKALEGFYGAFLWEDTTTILPLRAVMEELGCEVSWIPETMTVVITKEETEVSFDIDSDILTVNGEERTMPVPAMLVGEVTYIPIRAVAEALGATIGWESDSNSAGICTVGKTNAMRIASYEVTIGSTVSELTSICGEPSYKIVALNGLYWYVYNEYPAAFMAVATDAGLVCGYYTNSSLFVNSDGHKYGDKKPEGAGEIVAIDGEHCTIYEYYDTIDNTLCAVYHIRDGYENVMDANLSLANQSKMGLDILNSFRYSKGLMPLSWDEYAASSSVAHSEYMTNLGELTHTGIDGSSAIQRYLVYNPDFRWKAWGENICAEAQNIFTCINSWINSPYHRTVMLSEKTHCGIGMFYNPYGKFNYCATMFMLK